jgi:hypothetical protein
MYAEGGGGVAERDNLKRRAFFVDERTLRRARKALGVRSDAEAVRVSLERVADMETFWRFMRHSRRRLDRGSIRP